MVRGSLGKVATRSLSVAAKWQQQQQLRRLYIHEYQGADLTGKHGINVPKGVAVSSVEEVRKAIKGGICPPPEEYLPPQGELSRPPKHDHQKSFCRLEENHDHQKKSFYYLEEKNILPPVSEGFQFHRHGC